jgi:hypothetical protein
MLKNSPFVNSSAPATTVPQSTEDSMAAPHRLGLVPNFAAFLWQLSQVLNILVSEGSYGYTAICSLFARRWQWLAIPFDAAPSRRIDCRPHLVAFRHIAGKMTRSLFPTNVRLPRL